MENILILVPALIIAVIVTIALESLKSNNSTSGSSEKPLTKREAAYMKEYEDDVAKYKNLFSKIPGDLTKQTLRAMGHSVQALSAVEAGGPDKFTNIFIGAGNAMQEGLSGNITSSQRQQISKLISDFDEDLNTLLPAVLKAISSSSDQGLDFGIITSSAADAMLYTAMNTKEKIKNEKKMIRTVFNLFDNKAIAFTNELQRILAESDET